MSKKKEMNESQLRLQMRKNQSDLAAIGLGVIAFGIWSVIKSVLSVALDTERALGSFEGDKYLILAFWIMLAILLAIDLALRFYIGSSAIAEGKGASRSAGYIVLALLMGALSFVLLVAGLFVQDAFANIVNTVVTMIVELTSDVLMLEMGISAIRVRRLRRILGAET